MRALTEGEFNEWLAHPGTRALVAILHVKREELRQMWEGGAFTDYAAETTALVNVGNLGTCKGYAYVTDFSYETYLMEIEDGKPVGAQAPGSSGADSNV